MSNNILRQHMQEYETMLRLGLNHDILFRQHMRPYDATLGRQANLQNIVVALSDGYYSKLNGRFIGGNPSSNIMRLIVKEEFTKYNNAGYTDALQCKSKIIFIEKVKIQEDLQAVADRTSTRNANKKYQEHQIYITLDKETAIVSSVFGEPGTHDKTNILSYPAPHTGVNFVDKPGGLWLIGQAHGHPPTDEPGKKTEKTMSDEYDKPTSANLNIPIYGLDAMDGKTKGNPTAIHRVTPDGTITTNVGDTGSFNIGLDALQIWVRRSVIPPEEEEF